MTKAKDNNDRPFAETARARIEKALELLDKVEKGGVNVNFLKNSATYVNRHGVVRFRNGWLSSLDAIADKYILIERE